MNKNILIVEDDLTFSTMLKTWLTKKGFVTYTAHSCSHARKEIEQNNIDIILSDMRLPDEDGIHLISWLKEKKHSIPLIIMTSYADVQGAVNAMKSGACDYISKPIHPEELLKKIKEQLETEETSSDTTDIAKDNTSDNSSEDFMEGRSDAAQQLYRYVDLVAPTPMAVLINGASGTGKEHIAHRIHKLSKRAHKPFVAIDCGSIPKELAASEFFGHIKGSFTGALNDKTGAFIEANGGTLFLDEIGNLSYEVQIQLLRALQEKRIRPIGSTTEITVDIRLISATNENLPTAISNGTFREDLFHRINEFALQMPSLKERKEDILLFANFFLDRANKELNRNIIGFDEKACKFMQDYAWPGNLRELKNSVKRATLLTKGNYINIEDMGFGLQEENKQENNFTLHNEEEEKKRITEALKQADNNKSKAAQLLGIDRKTLYNKLKLYNI